MLSDVRERLAASRPAVLAAVCLTAVVAALVYYFGSPSAVTGTVCIATGDLLLVPFSRGTAEGFTQIAAALADAGFSVHAALLAHTANECLMSLRGVQLHLPGVTASCTAVAGDGPLGAAAALREHLETLHCDVVLSHEWWAPLAQLTHDRLLFPGRDGCAHPVLVTNFMGGLMWSRSWDRAYNNTVADWVQDYLEREGNFAVDFLVFSNEYHMHFHNDRWALLGEQRVGPNIVPMLAHVRSVQPDSLPVVGLAYVSVVDKRKGIVELLDCVLGLPDVQIRLEIIGSLGVIDDEEARDYIDRRLGNASHVNYVVHGPMDPTKVWHYVKQQQLLLVCPSLLENAPTTINLAVAYDIPLLYYDTGGVLEMVTPESAVMTVLKPSVEELQRRVRAALARGSGSVPVLQEIMFRAKPIWLDMFRSALAHKRAPPPPRPPLAPTYVALLLDDERTTTDSLAAQLARLPAGVGLVVLRHPGFELVDGEPLAAMRHALAENPAVAGFVGLVQSRASGVLKPAGPFFYASQAWDLCGPEAPLLVRAPLLAAFLGAYPGAPFRQWQFTSWLVYVRKAMVLQPPYVTSSFDGCFDTRECFASGVTPFDSPRRLLLGSGDAAAPRVPDLHQPHATHARRAAHADLRGLLWDRCARQGPVDQYWVGAAVTPRFCKGTAEHGDFTLGALQSSIAHQAYFYCGNHCIFNALLNTTSSKSHHGWHFDMQRECWYELEEATGKGAHAHLCSGVHALLHRSLPWGSVCPEAAEDPDT